MQIERGYDVDEGMPQEDAAGDPVLQGKDLSPRPTCSGTGRLSKDFRLRDYIEILMG